MEKLIFQQSPKVIIATNTFIDVPIILQYESQPLIEIVHEMNLGYTTQIPIFHSDGTYLAKVKGTRVYPTEDGKKAGIKMEHPQGMTVCKMDNKTLFEIRHSSGDSFRTYAELYTPDGRFVKCSDSPSPELLDIDGSELKVGGITMSNCTIQGFKIGILIRKNGGFAIGANF